MRLAWPVTVSVPDNWREIPSGEAVTFAPRGGYGNYNGQSVFTHGIELGVTHRRGGYRDPESQALIESWFGKLKQRLVWRSEFETLDDARAAIAAYADSYHQRPHSGLRYRTPTDVRRTSEDGQRLLKTAA